MTNTIRTLLLFLSLSLPTLADVTVNTENDISPNALMMFGATHTCIDDGKRCFYTYIPDCASENAPLVFDIHGLGQSPLISTYLTGWRTKSEENCFVLVLPLGHTDPRISSRTCFGFPGGLTDVASKKVALPCCCGIEQQVTVTDDATFLRNVAAVVVQIVPEKTSNKVTIDTKRIYMAGHSNGCMASIAMATLNSDVVAAVGCHAGTALAAFPDSYIPTPMMIIHGDADPVVPYNGNFMFLSALSVHSLVANANGCTENEETRKVDEVTNSYTKFTSTSCANNSTVVLLALDNVGHVPYKGFEYIEEGTLPTKIDTTQHAWEFVSPHSLDDAPELSYDGQISSPTISDSQISSPTISPTDKPTMSPDRTRATSLSSYSSYSSLLFYTLILGVLVYV